MRLTVGNDPDPDHIADYDPDYLSQCLSQFILG